MTAQQADLATRLIEQFGTTGTFIRQAATVDDPTKPWRGADSPVEETTQLRCVRVPPGSGLGVEFTGEGFLERADEILIVEPGVNDLHTYHYFDSGDGKRFRIQRVETLRPAVTTIMHIVELRR